MALSNIFLQPACFLWLASGATCHPEIHEPKTHDLEFHDPETCLLQMDSSFLQMDLKIQQTALHQFLEQLNDLNASKPLSWRTLRRFPPSRREYACHTAPNYFLTDPDLVLTADIAEMDNGCINLAAQPKVVMATNGSHRYDAYRFCTGSCLEDQSWQRLSTKVVNHDLLVLPSLRTPPGMEYQHGLSDLLPAAWSVLAALRDSKRLVIHSPVHARMLSSLGIPAKHLLLIPLTSWDEQKLLCVSPGRTLSVWRTGRPDGTALPTLDYADPRIFADYWWRLPAYRLAPELSDGIATAAGFSESQQPNSVIFLQRCSERRRLVNEQEALAAVSAALVSSPNDFQLLSFCPGREDFLEQVRKIRQARLIIGEHGGAMANMLLSRNGTGIIELVGSPEAQVGLQGAWPPYKSLWYGGAGAAFEFYRVVLYEASSSGPTVRLEDLQEAVQQWLQRRS